MIKLWDTNSKAGIGEINFYRTFEDVGARIPKCFYSAVDEGTNRAVLVLEDIKNGTQGDVLEQLDLERAKGVARNLAVLHSTWLDHPKLATLSWMPNASTWTPESSWIRNRRTLFLERFPNLLNGLARLLLDRLELAPKVANERLKNVPTTLLHGDFHLDNFIFENQSEPVILDWARTLKGPLTINLSSLLFGMTSLQNFEETLDCYLAAFNQIAGISLKKAVIEYQLGGEILRGFASSTCGIALWRPSLPRAVKMIDVGIKQTARLIDFWHARDPDLFSFLR